MKQNLFFLLIVALIMNLIGCASTMKFDKRAYPEIPKEFQNRLAPNLEFIGFKADANNLSTGNGESVTLTGAWSKETYYFPSDFELWKNYEIYTPIKNIGSNLEKSNVASDKSFSYFGIYSLQEIELYKSEKRYVTFIEVNRNHLRGRVEDNWLIPGSIILGSGLGLVSGGGVWVLSDSDNYLGLGDTGRVLVGTGLISSLIGSIMLAIPAKTTLMFSGEYQIYIYDTLEKKIIYKDSVTISRTDTFNGSFFNEQTNKYEVYEYYGTILNNEILRKYVEVEKFLNTYDTDSLSADRF